MDFCDRLADLRRERGLTQVQLAERVGITPTQLHRYENGTAQPALDTLRRLVVALSTSADALLFADEATTNVAERLRTAVETTAYLSEHQQVVIAEVIEAFVAQATVAARPNRTRGPAQRRRRTTTH